MEARLQRQAETTQPMTFDAIYQQNADRILNLAFRMTGKETLSHDIVQDVFMKVYQKLDTFRDEAQLSTWIYKIALNHIINVMKREKRFFFSGSFTEDSALKARAEKETVWEREAPESPDQYMETRQRETLLRAFIEKLPAKYKIPLLLYRYENMSYREIAEQLQISVSAVETRIHRARKKLAGMLEPWLEHI
ncbi:MAG: RNA polymerase sigma factor [Calditrichaeota bacterium]|nr:MAG: RNA polymerase sigma factor [Calditrichota bacterium]